MHRRYPARLQAALQVEVEIRRIDAYEYIGRIRDQPAAQPAADADYLDVMLDDFELAAHGKLFQRKPDVHASGFHARPANADDLERGQKFAQRADQLAAEQITRRLARDHADHAPAGGLLSG